jgi:hypothetical protein
MKTKLIVTILSLLGIGSISGQSCSKYYPLKEGTKFQITTFDKKEKAGTIINYLVKEVEHTSAGEIATFSTEFLDDKGELVLNSEYKIICKDNIVSIDFKSMIGQDIFSQYKDAEIEMSGTNIEIPNNLNIGQLLPDADMLMKIKMTPINLKMSMKMTNRKVENKEKITTPAGTFDCIVLSYDTEFKMGIKRLGSSKQWFAEGIGMVKSEEYNKKGKFKSKSLLTKFSN